MIRSYSDFIVEKLDLVKEGAEASPTLIYWEHRLNDILDKNWTDIVIELIRTNRDNIGKDKYLIKFKIGDDKYDSFGALIDSNNNLLMEDTGNAISKFEQKFKTEFWKNPTEYINKMDFDPKFLGDVSHIRDAGKYNL